MRGRAYRSRLTRSAPVAAAIAALGLAAAALAAPHGTATRVEDPERRERRSGQGPLPARHPPRLRRLQGPL